MIDRLLRILRGYRFMFQHEADLQRGIAEAFEQEGLTFTTEEQLGEHGRIDFWFAGEGIGIEVKVDCSVNAINRQLQRYAMHPDCKTLILATSRLQHLRGIPMTLQEVPIYIARIRDVM